MLYFFSHSFSIKQFTSNMHELNIYYSILHVKHIITHNLYILYDMLLCTTYNEYSNAYKQYTQIQY